MMQLTPEDHARLLNEEPAAFDEEIMVYRPAGVGRFTACTHNGQVLTFERGHGWSATDRYCAGHTSGYIHLHSHE